MNWYKKQLKIAMPAPINWSPGQIEKIRKMVLDGKKFSEIGKIMGVAGHNISRLNRKYKWREARDPYQQKDFSDDELKIIKDLLDGGESFKEIGELFGVSRTVIQRLNDKHKWREKMVPKDLSSYVYKVVEMFKRDMSIGQIKRELNGEITESQIRMILEKENLKDSPRRNTREYIEEQKRERGKRDKQIAHMYLLPPKGLGKSLLDIAKHFGIKSHTAIKKSLIRSGLGDRIRSREESTNLSGGRDRQGQKIKEWWRDTENKARHIEKLKNKWRDPDYAKMQSEKTKKWWDENEWAKEYYSQMMFPIMKKRWEDMPGEPGEKFGYYLTSMDSKRKAVNCLNGFIASKYDENPEYASAMRNKYIQIINNHTYPDEVQQPVIASTNWYKKIIESQFYGQSRKTPEDKNRINPYLFEDSEFDLDPFYEMKNEIEKDNANYFAEENRIRFEKEKKVRDHEDVIKELEEQLKNPLLSEEDKKIINKRIGYKRAAISKILNHTPAAQKNNRWLNDLFIKEPDRQR